MTNSTVFFAVLPDAQQLDLHQVAGLRVERRERLVHQQHVGIGGERAGEADALLHAAGQLVREMALEAGEPDHLDQRLRDLAPRLARHALELEAELDVVLHGAPGQQPELLEHHRAVGAGPGDRLAVHADVAGVRLDQPEQDIEEGALAAAGGADDRQELALADVDVEVLQRAHRPAVRRPEREIDVATLNVGLHAIDPARRPL